jgi:hypothetical protein
MHINVVDSNRLIKPQSPIGSVWSMVLNVTFNNISVVSWRSVLLVEIATDLPQITDTLYHIMLYRLSGKRTHSVSGDSNDCIGRYKIQRPYDHDHDGI